MRKGETIRTPGAAPFTLRPRNLLVDALTRGGVVVRAIEGARRRSHIAPISGRIGACIKQDPSRRTAREEKEERDK